MRFEAGDSASTLEESVDGAERILDDRLDVKKSLADALFGKLEDRGLGIVEDIVGGIGLLRSFGNRGIGDMDKPTQDRLVADDLDVVFDGRPVGHAVEKAGDIGGIADRLEFFLAVEFLDESDDVDGPGVFGQIHHAGVEAAMCVEREIVRLQMFGGVVVGMIVEQDRAEDGTLGFDVRGHAPEIGLNSRHDV